MKKMITRMTMLIMAVLTITIMTALPISAAAVENNTSTSITETTDENTITVQPMVDDSAPTIQQLESGSEAADSAYESTMDFILTWIRRIGAAVALFGAIMLALALKKDDMDQKENGIKTMVAGFVVWAITGAVDLFDLFT